MYKCKKCNSTKIQTKQWVELNTGKNIDSASLSNDTADQWCPECEEHCEIVDAEEHELKTIN